MRDAERVRLIRRQRRRVVLWQALSMTLFLSAGLVAFGSGDEWVGLGVGIALLPPAVFAAAGASISRISLAVLANPALEQYEHGWFPGYSFMDFMGLDYRKPRPALGGVPVGVPVSRPPAHRNNRYWDAKRSF